MFRKSVALVSRSVHHCNSIRALSVLQSSPTESYLRHTGSEPLIQSTLGEVLLASANKYPNRIALRSFQEDITLTYEQLIKQADALGCALRAQGLEKGDRLAIWSHNNAAWVVGLVAAARAGFIAVLLNPSYENREVSFCLKKVGVKALLIGDTLPNRAYYKSLCQLIPGLQTSNPRALSADLFPELTTIIAAGKEQLGGTLSLDELVQDYANQDANKYNKELTPGDGSLILFTSGTTGEPKAVLDSNLGVVNNTYFVGKRLGCHDEVHNISIQSPLFHALGSIVSLLAALAHGSTATLATRLYNVTANLQALAAEKCTLVSGTPTMYVDMLALIEKSGFGRLSHLKAALAAGAPCSPELIRRMQRHLHVDSVKNLYGLSETTAGVFHSLPGDSVDLVAETVGYITDHSEVKVIDEHGNSVAWGAPGELAVRGYHTMLGYWGEPQKTRDTLTDDGWILTGDKFTISQDGYGRIVGRIKDIIVRGGENIAPKEIEDLLNTHPDIIESQVVGVSDERVGEEICAVVRVRPGAAVSLRAATAHLRGRLAKYKMPRILKTVDDFPKTVSGKIQKFKIKDLIEAGKL